MSGLRRVSLLALSLAAALPVLGGGAIADGGLTPGQEATQQLFYIVLIPALGIGILVMGLITYAVIKFRVRKGHTQGPAYAKTHDRRLETLWTVVPALILLVVGVAAFQTLLVTDTIPANPDVIVEVNAHQWYWNFNITFVRNGTWLNSTGSFASLSTTGALTVEKGLVVKLVLRSFDVAHAFYIPAFDLKIDVVPGHENTYWFQALQPGAYEIHCAEFCGLSHYTMVATLHVTSD